MASVPYRPPDGSLLTESPPPPPPPPDLEHLWLLACRLAHARQQLDLVGTRHAGGQMGASTPAPSPGAAIEAVDRAESALVLHVRRLALRGAPGWRPRGGWSWESGQG